MYILSECDLSILKPIIPIHFKPVVLSCLSLEENAKINTGPIKAIFRDKIKTKFW